MEKSIGNHLSIRFWLILCLTLAALTFSSCGTGGSDTQTPTDGNNNAIQEPADDEPTATLGEQNALDKANQYLDLTAFSYSGLVGQLEFEGFTNAEAVYGADNCGADWNEQAALKAQEYLDLTSFSRQGLIDQLIFEGFTEEQANYGVKAVGY